MKKTWIIILALLAGMEIAHAQYEPNGEGTYSDNNGFGYSTSAEYKQGFIDGYQAVMKKHKKMMATPFQMRDSTDADTYDGGYAHGKTQAQRDIAKAQ